MKEQSLYSAIYHQLLTDIQTGKYDGGMRLPTEKELMQRYFVSRITAKRALNSLSEAGLVVRVPGRGTFLKGVDPIDHIRSVRNTLLTLNTFSERGATDVMRGISERGRELGITMIATDNIEGCGSLSFDSMLTYYTSPVPGIDVRFRGDSEPIARVLIDMDGALSDAVELQRRAGHQNILILMEHDIPGGTYDGCITVKLSPLPDNYELYRTEIEKVFGEHPGITAVIACTDFTAQVVLNSRPALSMISISHLFETECVALSQFRLPLYEAGVKAVELLREGRTNGDIIMKAEYSDRGSVHP